MATEVAAHEPFPAVVMDRHWNVVDANAAADRFFGWLLGPREEPANVIRLMFAPDGWAVRTKTMPMTDIDPARAARAVDRFDGRSRGRSRKRAEDGAHR